MSIRELEEIQRRAWEENEQRARRMQRLQLSIAGGGVVILLVIGLGWRSLNRKQFAASEPLKYLGMQYQQEQTDLLRYAPLDEQEDRQVRQELDQALQDLSAEALPKQVEAIEQIREILQPRYAIARARVQKELPGMSETFEDGVKRSNEVFSGRIEEYNKAAAAYNAVAGGFPAILVRPLFGFPATLPPLKR